MGGTTHIAFRKHLSRASSWSQPDCVAKSTNFLMQQFVDNDPSFFLFFRCRTGVEHTLQRFIVIKLRRCKLICVITDRHCALRISKFRCKLPSSKIRDAGTKMFDDIPRPTCRSVYTVSDKRLRHGGSGYETIPA